MTNLEAKPRVALSARVSTGMQAEDGLSIAAQLSEMREYAAARGWDVVAEFVDPGVSGQTMDRPGIHALLAAAREGAFDIVLVHELSRLSRSVYDTFDFFEKLGKLNIGFASVKEPQFDLSSPTGRFVLTLIAAVNQYYLDILRMHTKKSKRQRARDGLYNASIPPLGYEHTGDAKTPPVIMEKERPIVLMIFEEYASGDHSYQEVADIVNEAGYKTRAGRRFSKDTIADIIRNPFYAGKVAYKEGRRGSPDEVYQGLHEPLISEDLWDAAHQVRQRHHHASRPFDTSIRPYLLSRIACCHACGRRLRAQSAKSNSYYREMSYARGYPDCPNSQTSAKADVLHDQIHAIIRLLRLPPDWQEELAELVGEDTEAVTLQNRRARLVARRRRLKEGYVHGDFDDDVDIYRRELDRIRQELAQLPSEDDLAQINEAASVLEELSAVWDDADPEDQQDLAKLMLREVRVDVVQDRVLFLRPTLPFIPLFRAIPLLEEREFGLFTPIWPVDPDLSLLFSTLSPVTELPEEPAALPFLPLWPWELDPAKRISPHLSRALKAWRKKGGTNGLAVHVPHQGVPLIRLDPRTWPEVTLETMTLEETLDQEAGSLDYLDTPLIIQDLSGREQLARDLFEVMGQNGYWHIVDIVPTSMPAHWIFRFFPEMWPEATRSFWTAYDFFNVLQKAGFQVEEEEQTFYEPVALGVVDGIVRQRPGLLAGLTDEAYEDGVGRIEEAIRQRGRDALVSSEVTLIEVVALKGRKGRRRSRRRKLALDTPRG